VKNPLAALFLREWRLATRIGGGGALGVMFFLILVTITPFAIGPDLALLARIGPALLWIAALLATLLGLDRLFQADDEDGSLDLLGMAEPPLELTVLVKCAAHWAATGLPLVIAAPVFGVMLALEPPTMLAVAASLLVGTPALTLIGAMGAALTATLRRGGLLMAILVLPMMIPTLIFGVAAAAALNDPLASFTTPFLLLCAVTLIALAGAPFAAAAALRDLAD
jgi:heme exporter protein B